MAYAITIAGTDVTTQIRETSIRIAEAIDTRSTTCEFVLVGPFMASLRGYQEVVVTDAGGNRVFGGYIYRFEDASDAKTRMRKVLCHDYTQYLSTKQAFAVWVSTGDVAIIKATLTQYAPWVDQSTLPTGQYNIVPRIHFSRVDVLTGIRRICDVTGLVFYIDAYKKAYYIDPNVGVPAPFSISDTFDNHTTYPALITNHTWDFASAANRVTVQGGTTRSNDYLETLTSQANGTNTVFYLQYRPRPDSVVQADNRRHIEVWVGGVAQRVGAENFQAFSDGFTVLVNYNSKLLRFQTAPANGAVVTCKYQYEIPILNVLTNQASHDYFGDWFDAKMYDQRLLDASVAQLRGQTIITLESFGKETGSFTNVRQPGLRVGQLIHITNSVRGISGQYMIRQVRITSMGRGIFNYECDYGAWKRKLQDQLQALRAIQQPEDNAFDAELSNEAANSVSLQAVNDILTTATFTDAVSFSQQTGQHYYPGAGYGSFPGFAVPTGNT